MRSHHHGCGRWRNYSGAVKDGEELWYVTPYGSCAERYVVPRTWLAQIPSQWIQECSCSSFDRFSMHKLFEAPSLDAAVVSSSRFESMLAPPSSLDIKSWWGNAIFSAMAMRLQNLLQNGRKPSKGWRGFNAFHGRQHEWRAGIVWSDGSKVCQNLPRACLVDGCGKQRWWPVLWVTDPYGACNGAEVVVWCQAQCIQLSCPWGAHASRVISLRNASLEMMHCFGSTRVSVPAPSPLPATRRQFDATRYSTVQIEEVFDNDPESCVEDSSNVDEWIHVDSSVIVGDVEEF